jgi:hypothetical protein
MTMHLVGPYMTTTSYRKPKQKKLTVSQIEKYQDSLKKYNKDLRRMGLQDMQMTLDEYIAYCSGTYKPKKKDTKTETYTTTTEPYRRPTQHIPSLGTGIGNGLKKQNQQYTGTLIKGIATMHKSNAVPILSKEEAISVANMRRG